MIYCLFVVLLSICLDHNKLVFKTHDLVHLRLMFVSYQSACYFIENQMGSAYEWCVVIAVRVVV